MQNILEVGNKLKYKISEMISKLPNAISIQQIEQILEEEHKINRITFYRDRCISLGQNKDIPFERLNIYAALFACTTEELTNYKIKTRSLKERNLKV